MKLKEDRIVSIEYLGEQETADIEIIDAEGEHQRNYFANGFNVHNSGAMAQYPAYKFKKAKAAKAEHPIIEKWTKDTYGLIIYQEQVMQIVRELGDFDWAQTNTVRKVMSKSGGAEYFMKTFWPTWKESCAKKGLDEATAEKAFKRIMSFGCVSGDTLIMNPFPNQNAKKWVKIEDLYNWDGYASPLAVGAKRAAYVKMQSYSFTQGRLKPNRIARVFYNGEKELFEIITESGHIIKATEEHRFVCKKFNGKLEFVSVKNLIKNKKLYEMALDGGYIREPYNLDFAKNIRDKNYGGSEVYAFRKEMEGKPCDICQEKFKNMEVHHITYENPNSRLMWLCNSCHKLIEHRKITRTKKDAKGHKIAFSSIKSIKSIGVQKVYDIEMEDRKRPTYIANGFVSHNSWAFNKTIKYSSKILNTNPNKFAPKWITIEQLYKNNGYATEKWIEQSKCYKKMNTLCMDSDGKLRPARIKKVHYHGKVKLWEIVTESGKKIELTKQHRLLGKVKGEEIFLYGQEIRVGTLLAINGGYEKTEYKLSGEGFGWAANYVGHKTEDTLKPFINGKAIEVNRFKQKMLGKPCQRCGRDYDPFDNYEVHHVTRTPPNSKLRWLCNSCHKIEDYELGNRRKVWDKGFSIHFEKVVSKKYVGIHDGYDIEMEDSSRPTFVANDFVSHNSHSVAYAFVSYFCMWFKYHYPLEYVTAYLNEVSGGALRDAKLKEMIREAERLGIKIKEPDVNISKVKFVISGNDIVAGLLDIKNIGEKAVEAIVKVQPFKDIVDFMERVDARACTKRTVENLIKAGAFNTFGYNQKKLLDKFPEISALSKKKTHTAKEQLIAIVNGCKGGLDFSDQEIAEMKAKVSPVNIGKHLSEYYTDVYDKIAKHLKITKLIDVELDEGQQQKDKKDTKRLDIWVCGTITSVDLKRLSQEVKDVLDKTQEQRYALANLEDDSDFIVLSFRGDIYTRYEQQLYDWIGKVMLVRGTVNVGWKKVYVDSVYSLEDLRQYLNNNRLPYNFKMDYLFQHPLQKYFGKINGGLASVKHKYKCQDLVKVKTIKKGESLWTLGIITDIQTMTARKGDMKGQQFYWVFYEDETFQGSFMVFPTDARFDIMKKELFELYNSHMPFLLNVQKDMKYKGEALDSKQVSISIDKRKSWASMIRKPFKFGG